MKVTVLADNIPGEGLRGEWGFSAYIESNGRNMLLDTGGSELFCENAEKLGIDLKKVDMAVLSHAHFDHANGMERFFEVNDGAKFFLRNGCGEDCYKRTFIFNKYIGIKKGTLERFADRIVYADGDYELCEGVRLIPHKTEGLEKIGEREKMYIKTAGPGRRFKADAFSHEQSLVFETENGLVIFNSCSHGGAADIINEVAAAYPGKKVIAMIGGFHLFNKSDEEVRGLAEKIRATGIEYICTGHCTGDRAYGILKEELGEIAHRFKTGLVIEL